VQSASSNGGAGAVSNGATPELSARSEA
jgi:hypothetical protein